MKVRTKSLENQPVDYTLFLFVKVTITRKWCNVRSKCIIEIGVHDIDGSLKPSVHISKLLTRINH